jgi:AAA domain
VSGAIWSKLWFDHAKEFFSAGCYSPEIVVLPDYDDPGRKHADTIGAAFAAVGVTVHILDLPDLPLKGDVLDWYDRGGTREQLDALIDSDARPWAPSEPVYPPDGPSVNAGATTKQILLPPPPDRASLTISAWLDRPLPDRDFLLGKLLCTTSRLFIIGETGIGKTLFGAAIGGACAKGAAFLNWEAGRPARVMFIDGEMPIETFKERMELIAASYGREIPFFGYNREDLGFDGMPPLNIDLGKAWLQREIEAIKPDLIIFDSVMCLLVGSMQDEATWAPMKPLVCELSARRIAQVWFNHANDLGKSFGDKTREWEMDTTGKLSKVEGDETAIRLEFIKARHRTPANAGQFAPLIFRPNDDWRFEIAKSASGAKSGGDVDMVRDEFIKAYDRLADGVTKSLGLDDRSSVRKVPVASIREELKDHGLLDIDDKGNIERVSRNHFSRAKKLLLVRRGGAGLFAERKGQIWRI